MNTTILSVTVPIMAIAALGLAVGVPSLRNALRTEELAILPLATGGTVDIREAGKLILSLRGSLGSRDFAKASFLLRDAAGNAAPSSLIALRSVRTRLNGETTLAAKRLTIAAPGRYLLEVAGVEPGSISSNSRIVLSRPGGATLAWRVAWVVVAALALLAGIAFSAVAAFAQSAPAEVFEPAAGPGAAGRRCMEGPRAVEPADQRAPFTPGIPTAGDGTAGALPDSGCDLPQESGMILHRSACLGSESRHGCRLRCRSPRR